MPLSADRNTAARGEDLFAFALAANTTLYAGAMVALNAGGYAVPASADASLRVVGRANGRADNANGEAGDETIAVEAGVFRWKNASAADAIDFTHVGHTVYAVDDETVALTSANGTRPVAGVVMDVDTVGVWVRSGLPHTGSQITLAGPFTKTLTGISSPIATGVQASDTFTVAGIRATDRVIGAHVSGTQPGAIHDVSVSGADEITVRTDAITEATFATPPVVTFHIVRGAAA